MHDEQVPVAARGGAQGRAPSACGPTGSGGCDDRVGGHGRVAPLDGTHGHPHLAAATARLTGALAKTGASTPAEALREARALGWA
ncbi:hypothetical protein ABZ669_17340 [Streptomyces hirsutus]|uniref:hypothetical protein n=1 Tax=Streptomyces hirsutus TaxID=35620 RepID=UPI0033C9C913